MKLQKLYERTLSENPDWSETHCLAHSIRNNSYSKGEIAKVFRTVDKDDYGEYDYEAVLDSLCNLSDYGKEPKSENIDQ